jgi:flagellar motor switch protein FliG
MSEGILEILSITDPTLAFDLKSRFFTADDIVDINDEFIQKELFALEDSEIAKLVAGKTEVFRKKIFDNLSTGRGERIIDEETLGTPFRKIDVESVTDIFLMKVRQEWGDGRIV